MIEARGIVVARKARPILRGVDFCARSGDVTAILGANGAGKSTLLRVLAGDLKPDAGTVNFERTPLARWRSMELARRRAVVSQSSALNFPFTVLDVIRQGRAPHVEARDRAADENAVLTALAAVDLAHWADRDYTTLSGGERQRVHLARALAQVGIDGKGRWLLLDEPTASLDLRHQHDILRIVRSFADSGGGAVVVLHDLNLCARHADKVALLHSGNVLGVGDVRAVLTPDWLQIAYGIPVRRHDMDASFTFSVA
jgi:iron complex transport system ATP-binding protein